VVGSVAVNPVKRKQIRKTTSKVDVEFLAETCTRENSIIEVPTKVLVAFIVELAQFLSEKEFYSYQLLPCMRMIESVLNHDAATITGLFSRQSGKTEMVAGTMASCAIALPFLANHPLFEGDWRLNMTDERGRYRGYKNGVKIGIYAPKRDQARLQFERLVRDLSTDTATQVLEELGLEFTAKNRGFVRLTNGSEIIASSASDTSHVEGSTHHILVMEEAQDISQRKILKSLRPMIAATKGSTVMIGTATTKKGEFYHSIRRNLHAYATGDRRDNFCVPWRVAAKENSLYREYVTEQIRQYGEDSDEIRMSYGCEWILERGMFVTPAQLMNPFVALTEGPYSFFHFGSKNKDQCAGIDFGKGQSSTVITVVEVDWTEPDFDQFVMTPDGEVHYVSYKKHVINWYEIHGDNWERQFALILEFLFQFPNMSKITLDRTGLGEVLCDRFIATVGEEIEVEGIAFSRPMKSDGYKNYSFDLMGGRWTFPANPAIRHEMSWKRFVKQMLDLQKTYVGNLMVCEKPDEKGALDDFPDSGMLSNISGNRPARSTDVEVTDNVFFMS